MTTMIVRLCAAGAAWLLLVMLVATAASADSGSITNVQALGNGRVAATFSATWTTCTPGPFGGSDCSWYPRAGELVASKSCPPDPSASSDLSFVWFGDYWSGSGTQTETAEFAVYRRNEPTRLCLYVEHNLVDYLVAEAVYTPPLPTLTVAKTKSLIRLALAERFEGSYVHGYGKRISGCRRLSRLRVTCRRVSWVIGDASFRGHVTASYVRPDAGVGLARDRQDQADERVLRGDRRTTMHEAPPGPRQRNRVREEKPQHDHRTQEGSRHH